MTAPHRPGDRAHRVAAVQLRGPAPRVRARVHWPAGVAAVLDRPPLVVLFTGSGGQGDAIAARLVERLGAVVLATSAAAGAEAHAALVWAADHAAELDADPGRLAVVGVGTGSEAAQRVAALAGADGWPLLLRVVLVRPGKDDEGDSACALDHLADALDTARLPTMEDR